MLPGLNRDTVVGFGGRFVFAILLLSSFAEEKGTAHGGFETFASGDNVQDSPCLGVSSSPFSCSCPKNKVKTFLQQGEALDWLCVQCCSLHLSPGPSYAAAQQAGD